MKRYYYLSDDLDDLEAVEQELEEGGVTQPQIHVLSEQDGEVERHRLHEVEPVLKQDVVHSTELGALIGVVAAALVLLVSYFSGMTTSVGWTPFVFLAIVALGFCTWEGGMFGIQQPHRAFRKYRGELNAGRHLFFVDVEPAQEAVLARVVGAHPRLEAAGTGASTPRWVIRLQNKWKAFIHTMP
ncbi:NAD/FAD-utilizing enzyme [Zobellella endophytica]|uniref:NAD/FAD-utilizing enzyme n=1 Tax=Zobellella endophytica TaxID=2116700 RepID=A0A2P7R6B2_9GAMM|nr:NAD/FAD-utilizing enzyme [Zobellella endophytica]PSJ45748.1 NAD/FAD-utilizing enzyme [Zobellella endophytica]